MNRIFTVLACLSLTLASFGAKTPAIRLDVTSQPDGANLFVDGTLRGVTPLQIFDLKAGTHHIRVEAAGHKTVDDFLTMSNGDYAQRNYVLQAETCLILIKSDPSGAEVRYNDLTIGNTPLLVTTLPVGMKHAFEIAAVGYQSRRIEIDVPDRTPIVKNETLSLDSGSIVCRSTPSGAEVFVNGISRGTTPVTVDNVPRGHATVQFKIKGYRDETREITMSPADRQTLDVELKGLPAKLTIVTDPEQARVLVDDAYQGKSPVTVSRIDPGRHTIKIEVPGYAVVEREITLENGEDKTENIKMDSVLGRLELITIPAGVKVMIDGRSIGTTVEKSGSPRSEIFAVENLEEGEHSLVCRVRGYQDAKRTITIEKRKTAQAQIRLVRLFVPDTIVETIHGTYRGVLVTSNEEGVVLEIRQGVEQTFPRADIRKITTIDQ